MTHEANCSPPTRYPYQWPFLVLHKPNYACCVIGGFYVTTRKNTQLMAEILRSLRDGGELHLMNGDNKPDGINLPRLWHYRVICHEVMTTTTTIHQRWGQLQRHKSQFVTAPPEAPGSQGGKKPEKKINVLVTIKKYCALAKAKSKQPLTELALRLTTEKYNWAKLALI